MFGFESILMQVASDTGNAALNSVVSIVISVGVIAGVLAPILKKFGGRLNVVGQYADTFAQKTVENQEEMYRALAAARTVVPELDDALKKYEAPLAKAEKRIVTGAEQIDLFREILSKSAQASARTDLPRENFKVDLKRRGGGVDAV